MLQSINVVYLNTKQKQIAMSKIECPECEGHGFHSRRNCNDSSSNCCGGCFEEWDCSNCDGTGEIDNEE
jgi:hypothetical protein